MFTDEMEPWTWIFLKNGELEETDFTENSLIFALYKNGQNLNVTILTLIFFEKSFSDQNNKMLWCTDEVRIENQSHWPF